MTAAEFVAQLAPLQLDRMALLFRILHEHLDEMRLSDGTRLTDLTDFRWFLYELATACECDPRQQRKDVSA